MNKLNRRRFIIASIVSAASLSAHRAARADDATTVEIDAGPLSEFTGVAVYDKLAKARKILLVRDEQRLIAVCAICTHKACSVRAHGQELHCSCHGSTFSTIGAVKKGPARDALSHLGIRLSANGHVVIDPSQHFAQDQWNDPKSFIAIK